MKTFKPTAGTFVAYNDGFTLITWNGSATFNVYFDMGNGFKECEVFTVYGVTSAKAAEAEAIARALEINEILEV